MAQAKLEQTLKDLPAIGKLVKERPYRQVWRFEHEGKAYYLKFYPREGVRERLHHFRDWFRRRMRGSPAVLEFTRLQMLQKAEVPAPRAVAVLMGFRVSGQRGDAVIMEAIEPAVQLDEYFNTYTLRGERAPDHREISRQVRELVKQLAAARLGHDDLHLGNFLLSEGKVYLLDGYAVRRGMRARDVYRLAHSVIPFATLTDLVRGYELLVGGFPPKLNPISPQLRRSFLKRIGGNNRYFGRLDLGEWTGVFFRSTKFAKRWSQASTLQISEDDWQRIWPDLWRKIESDQLKILKRSRSGDVFATEITLGGQTLPVIIKRPRKRYWYRYLNEIPRRSRSWRGWAKGWNLIARNLPTAWPLLVMERRKFGYVTDHVSIFERVPGTTLGRVDLDSMSPPHREMLFRRVGRILRLIDETGWSHFDAKAPNWIVTDDPKLGPYPVLIDTDAVRFRRWVALGIERLLRSMKDHPQYTREDSLALCLGYAPYSPPSPEEVAEEVNAAQESSSD
ncbi:MAG TPA: lipopolysaccharide kinase InaA family protein [Tepidisphaeraceae bacterium]|nr:lipopolysaccharide kinase InaA family protein [Tepidisphaeraceae bacterium]